MRSPAIAFTAISRSAILIGSVLTVGVGVARVVNRFRYPQPPRPVLLSTDPDDFPDSLPSVRVTRLSDGLLHGFHLRPDVVTRRGVVFVWGGSDGTPDFFRAQALAAQGFEVFSLFVFGQPGQPEQLSRVPLEFFDHALDYADAHAADPGVVTVLGSSKGAELAALLSGHVPRIDNVVLFAPSEYVFQGLDFRAKTSSWSRDGEEVPFIPFGGGSPLPGLRMLAAMVLGYPMRLRPVYLAALDGASDVQRDAARIDLSRVKGRVLVFAGDDDQMWQADLAAWALADHAGGRAEVHVYPGAGHVFAVETDYAGGFLLGGAAEANRAAFERSNQLLLERLAQWHA